MDHDAPLSPQLDELQPDAFDDLVFDIVFAIRHKLPVVRRDLGSQENCDYVGRRVATMLRRRYQLARRDPAALHSTPDMTG